MLRSTVVAMSDYANSKGSSKSDSSKGSQQAGSQGSEREREEEEEEELTTTQEQAGGVPQKASGRRWQPPKFAVWPGMSQSQLMMKRLGD